MQCAVSDRPADEKHTYGYGKVENLSALFEAFLLLVTCAWIIYEAINRLFFSHVEVEISIWSFIVMATSIVIDYTRSRALMKAAKKHNSQALEADALHFSTDIWSSAVVIIGLALVTIGKLLQQSNLVSPEVVIWLNRADAIAALGVSIIVIYVSVELGKKTIEGLLDTSPQGMKDEITAIAANTPGVLKVRRVRVRPSGPYTFVDMLVEVPRTITFEKAHDIAAQIRGEVLNSYPRIDVVVHTDPTVQDENSPIEMVHSISGKLNLHVHSIFFHTEEQTLEYHLEVSEGLSVAEAHEKADQLENLIRKEIPHIKEVFTHIEPTGDIEIHANDVQIESEDVRQEIELLHKKFPEVLETHQINIWKQEDRLSVSFHCIMRPDFPIRDAHRLSTEMEQYLRATMPQLKRVTIHVEPADDNQPN